MHAATVYAYQPETPDDLLEDAFEWPYLPPAQPQWGITFDMDTPKGRLDAQNAVADTVRWVLATQTTPTQVVLVAVGSEGTKYDNYYAVRVSINEANAPNKKGSD
jgi:hypothetical protein